MRINKEIIYIVLSIFALSKSVNLFASQIVTALFFLIMLLVGAYFILKKHGLVILKRKTNFVQMVLAISLACYAVLFYLITNGLLARM
jgi:hypothetical protein